MRVDFVPFVSMLQCFLVTGVCEINAHRPGGYAEAEAPRAPDRNVVAWHREISGAAKKTPISARQRVVRRAFNIELGGAGGKLATCCFGAMGVYFADTGKRFSAFEHLFTPQLMFAERVCACQVLVEKRRTAHRAPLRTLCPSGSQLGCPSLQSGRAAGQAGRVTVGRTAGAAKAGK